MATKEVNLCLEYYMDLKEAYHNGIERGMAFGWFMGERVYHWSVQAAKDEWQIAKFRRAKMDKMAF